MATNLLDPLRESSGDGKVWEQAYRVLRPLVYRTAYGLMGGDVASAEDITQEAFLRFLQYTDLKALENDDHLLAYLRQTVRHLCWQRRRKQISTVSIDAPEAERALSVPLTNEEEIEDLTQDIDQLAGRLPTVERQLLRELIAGASLPEIARKLDITYGAASVRVHRLRVKLRSIINDL